MNYKSRKLLAVITMTAAVLVLASCAKVPEIELPPVPTYSQETPVPTAENTPVPSPVPSVKPSSEPIVYNTPAPTPVPAPVPTVNSEVPVISITGATLPDDMVQYNVATLHGNVVTNKGNITKVEAKLLDSAETAVQECSFQPYKINFSLAGTVNARLTFGTLQPGTYTYILVAEAENAGLTVQKELIHHRFTVFSTADEMTQFSDNNSTYTAKITQEESVTGRIWNFLIVYLDNPYGAAGVMGNIDVESQCNPQRVQGDLSTDFAFSKSYTEQVDSGIISKETFVAAIAGEGYGSGYGLCQWSFERKEGLYDLAKERGCSVGDLDTQCIYMVMELEMNYPELLELLRSTDDPREAAREFFYVFEQGAEMGSRAERAEFYLEKYAK